MPVWGGGSYGAGLYGGSGMSNAAGRVTNDPTNYFALGVQSAKGTAATKLYYFRHEDGSGFDLDESTAQERQGGSGREVGLTYRTKATSDGQVVTYAFADCAGRLLAAALGTDAVASGPSTASSWSHPINSQTLATQNTTLPYLTSQQAWADNTESGLDNLISELKIEGEAQKPIKFTASFVCGGSYYYYQGVGATGLVTPSVAREVGQPAMYPGASVWMSFNTLQGTTTPGATSVADVTKFTLGIKNALDDGVQTTALTRADVPWLTQDFTLDGTIRYTSNAIYNAIMQQGGTQIPTGLLTNGSFNIFSGIPSFVAGSSTIPAQSLLLTMPYIEFTALKLNKLDPDGKTMYLDFTAIGRGLGAPVATQTLQATVVSAFASTSYLLATT